MKKLLLTALVAVSPCLSWAQSVEPCDHLQTNLQMIAEPMANSIKTFANGEVDLVLIDTVEPAAASYYISVLHPPRDENFGFRICSSVGPFSGVHFEQLRADYDPTRGLLFFVETQIPNEDATAFIPMEAQITVNQAIGLTTLEMYWLD